MSVRTCLDNSDLLTAEVKNQLAIKTIETIQKELSFSALCAAEAHRLMSAYLLHHNCFAWMKDINDCTFVFPGMKLEVYEICSFDPDIVNRIQLSVALAWHQLKVKCKVVGRCSEFDQKLADIRYGEYNHERYMKFVADVTEVNTDPEHHARLEALADRIIGTAMGFELCPTS